MSENNCIEPKTPVSLKNQSKVNASTLYRKPLCKLSGLFFRLHKSKGLSQPATPVFFDMHSSKNILRNLHRNFGYSVPGF